LTIIAGYAGGFVRHAEAIPVRIFIWVCLDVTLVFFLHPQLATDAKPPHRLKMAAYRRISYDVQVETFLYGE